MVGGIFAFIGFWIVLVILTIIERQKLKAFSPNWMTKGWFIHTYEFNNLVNFDEESLQKKLNASRVAAATRRTQ